MNFTSEDLNMRCLHAIGEGERDVSDDGSGSDAGQETKGTPRAWSGRVKTKGALDPDVVDREEFWAIKSRRHRVEVCQWATRSLENAVLAMGLCTQPGARLMSEPLEIASQVGCGAICHRHRRCQSEKISSS